MKQLKLAFCIILLFCSFGAIAQETPLLISKFSLMGNEGKITKAGNKNYIDVSVPRGTDLTKLIATFTANGQVESWNQKDEDWSIQTSGVATINDFSRPVVFYRVLNGENEALYFVTVNFSQ